MRFQRTQTMKEGLTSKSENFKDNIDGNELNETMKEKAQAMQQEFKQKELVLKKSKSVRIILDGTIRTN